MKVLQRTFCGDFLPFALEQQPAGLENDHLEGKFACALPTPWRLIIPVCHVDEEARATPLLVCPPVAFPSVSAKGRDVPGQKDAKAEGVQWHMPYAPMIPPHRRPSLLFISHACKMRE